MEEVEFDTENSVYMTALNSEFLRTKSIESDAKNESYESFIIEDEGKIEQNSQNIEKFDYKTFESDEQPPPDMTKVTTSSVGESKGFEDIKLEDTLKEITKIHLEEKEEYKVLEDVRESSSEENIEELEEKTKDSVLIKSTKLVKSGLFGVNSYYVYEIVSVLNNDRFRVCRRFKDFEWLYNSLKENYKGLSVPSLPSKTLKVFQDASEAEIRRIQLEKILNMILTHSTLRKSQQIYLFLTTPEIEFHRTKEKIKKHNKKFRYNDLEDAIDQIVSKIQAKMNQIFRYRIVPFNQDILEIQKHLKNLEVPSQTVFLNFSSYLFHQEKSSNIIQSMQFLHDSSFNKSVQMLKHVTVDQYRDLKSIKQQLNTENLKIEALQGGLEDYKKSVRRYSELEALVERKIKKSMKYLDDSEKYLTDIAGIKKGIKDLEKDIQNIEENVKKEKIWFQADRNEKFEQVLASIIEVSYKKAVKEEEFWLNLKHDC